MATGASTADLAVVLVDARKGLLTQTRRHSYIVSLLGIRHVVLAVNKMDLVGFDQERVRRDRGRLPRARRQLGIERVTCDPALGAARRQPARAVARMPWYDGPSLLAALGAASVERAGGAGGAFRCRCSGSAGPNRFPRLRRHRSRRQVRVGDPVVALPSGRRSTVARDRHRRRRARSSAPAPARRSRSPWPTRSTSAAATVLAAAADPPEVADQFAAHLLWMDDQPLLPGRPTGCASAPHGRRAGHRDQAQGRRQHPGAARGQAPRAQRGRLLQPEPRPAAAVRAVRRQPRARRFMLIDRQTNATVGAGT
jgi:bifunctional enzyme CysN/CysC